MDNCSRNNYLQGLKSDFLRFVDRGSLDSLEFVHEFAFEGLVVGFGPGSVFFERLSDRDLKVEASTADLASDGGSGELLQLGKVFIKQCLAGFEALRVARSSRGAGGVLNKNGAGEDCVVSCDCLKY